jgi:hypothetical protein
VTRIKDLSRPADANTMMDEIESWVTVMGRRVLVRSWRVGERYAAVANNDAATLGRGRGGSRSEAEKHALANAVARLETKDAIESLKKSIAALPRQFL